MPPAAILDIDGTLVDTKYQHALAWYEAFRQQGVQLPVWRIHRHIGMGGDQLVRDLTDPAFDEAHGDEVRSAESALYLAAMRTVAPLEGARDLIELLRRRGHAVVLASSAKAQEVDHYIDLLDARSRVDGWTTSDDVERTKPEPDLVRAALDKLGTDDAVMVGDTPWDVEAALKAKVPTIAVRTGGFSGAERGRRRGLRLRLDRRAGSAHRRDAPRRRRLTVLALALDRPPASPSLSIAWTGSRHVCVLLRKSCP